MILVQDSVTMLAAIFILSAYVGHWAHAKHLQNEQLCGPSYINNSVGIITSPYYPSSYPDYVSCTWVIVIPSKTVLTISITDFDIEEDPDCLQPPCCKLSWLSVPRESGDGIEQYCGSNMTIPRITVSQHQTFIKFHSSKVLKGGRGFNLTYTVDECGSEKVLCPDGRCVLDIYGNRAMSCGMGTCENPDELPCGVLAHGCYNISRSCDGIKDCPYGEDEENCTPELVSCLPSQHLCADGLGCFTTLQRCDNIQNCQDNSDEKECVCPHAHKRCGNYRCVLDRFWCNGIDDCGDNSDEDYCVKNSIITAAIMGSLLCGLLLVIAIGCMCRLYSMRLMHSSGCRVHREENGYISNYPRMVMPYPDEIFYREPPPTYSIAVADCQPMQGIASRPTPAANVQNADRNVPMRHCRRVARRHHPNGRRRSQRLQGAVNSVQTSEVSLTCQQAVCKADDDGDSEVCRNVSPVLSSSSATSSPSCVSPNRESDTSSSSLHSYGSTNDDVQLLIP